MKFKLAILTALFLVSFTGLVLADSNLDINMSSTTLSGSHNSNVVGSFTLTNLNTGDSLTNLSCSISIQGWTTSCTPTSPLAANQSQTVSVTVSVPQSTAPGSYSGTITARGNLSSTGTAASDTQSFSVTVATSASLSPSTTTTATSVFQGQNLTVSFNVTNNGNVALQASASMDLSSLGLSSFNQSLGTLSPAGSASGTISILTTEETNIGEHTLSLVATGTGTANATATTSKTLNVVFPFCSNLTAAKRPLRIDEIEDTDDIEGEEFDPLDSLKVRVKVENLDDDDSQTARVFAVVIEDGDELSDTDLDKKIKVQDDDTETVTLNLTLPADIKEGIHYLYVKMENDDDEDNCEQQFFKFEVKKNSREVVPADIEFPETLVCGEKFTFNAKAANIGENDEDKVLVQLKAFGQVFDDEINELDEGDDSAFNFEVPVTKDFSGVAKMVLTMSYDYDEDDNSYDESEPFSYSTTVTCGASGTVALTAESSTVSLGGESEIKVLVKNPTTASKTYTFSVSAPWASVNSLNPASLTLQGGNQEYVSVLLQPNEGLAAGTRTLTFTATDSASGEKASTNVLVSIRQGTGTSAQNLFADLKSKLSNNLGWTLINAVLVIAILVVLYLILNSRKNAVPSNIRSL